MVNYFKYSRTLFESSIFKRRLVLVLMCGLAWGSVFAQQKDIEKADAYFQAQRYAEAAELYERVLSKFSEKKRESRQGAVLASKLARCYRMNNRNEEAAKWYEQAVSDERARPEWYFEYGETLMSLGRYEEAKKWLRMYRGAKPEDSTTDLLLKSCEVAPGIQPYFPYLLVEPFPYNSEADDNAPVWWNGGIVFSSDRRAGIKLLREKSGWTGRDFLDLYYSARLPDGTFAAPEQFSSKLSMLNKNVCNASLTADGSEIFFTRNDSEPNRRETYNLQLYTARWDGSKWKDVQKLPFCSSSFNYMHPAISPDGSVLVFTSDRPGGQGGTDLWVSRRTDTGWERPENLGPHLNTPLNEGFPFIDAMGRLFFCSKGHPGLGGFDVFVSEPTANGAWGAPVNLGPPINSPADDISVYLAPDQHWGMFTSAREGGDDDVYIFRVVGAEEWEAARKPKAEGMPPKGVSIASKDPAEKPMVDRLQRQPEQPPTREVVEHPLGKQKVLEEHSTKVAESKATVDSSPEPASRESVSMAGKDVHAPVGAVDEKPVETPHQKQERFEKENWTDPSSKTQTAIAAADGFRESAGLPAPVMGVYAFDDLRRKINLNSLRIGDRFRLDGARYDVNVWQPTPQVAKALDALAALLKEYPYLVIEIGSHTESVGLDEYNLKLSENRARLARDYLIREGISPDRIVAKGYGETQLLNHCANGVDCSRAEHLVNQRLEVKIIGM